MAEANVGQITATLRVDTTAWTQGLQQAQQQLAQFQQSTSRLSSALNQTQQHIQNINNVTNIFINQTTKATRATGEWSQALQVAGGIGIATSIQGIVSSLTDFAKSAITVATNMQALRTSLSSISGAAGAGAAQFAFLVETANTLGVALEPLARGWRTLAAAASQTNLPLADQQRLLTAVANEARRTGASSEQLQSALLALSQMASKGVVSMEELRQQLGEALVTALSAAARGFGVTTDELIKLVETGTVRFPTFARALTRGLEEMQSKAQEAGTTAQQAFARLGNAMTILKDELGQNVLPELVRISGVLTDIATKAANILRSVGGRSGGTVGPSIGDLGATENQQKELERLSRLIQLYSQQASAGGTPEMQAQRASMLAAAKEQYDQVLASVRATQDEATAQAKVTAEANRTTAAREREVDWVKQVQEALTEIQKQQTQLREKAALAPAVFGTAGGTSEQQIELLRRQQQLLEPALEGLAGTLRQRPTGATLPQDLQNQVQALLREYGKLDPAIDAIREKEQERARAAREAAAEEQRAAGQLIQIHAVLQRAKEFIAREDENEAQRAQARVREQGIAQQRALEQQILAVQRSGALQRQEPGLLQQLQDMRGALAAALPTQELQAFNNAMEKNVLEPLRRLGEAYGMTREARDADKASMLEAMAVGTAYEEEARRIAQAVRDSATMLAKVPRLEQEAALSASRFETERSLTQRFEDRLAQLRTTSGQQGFPFEETRETVKLRQEAARAQLSDEGQARVKALREQILAQEQLNYMLGVYEQFAGSIGNAWTTALSDIAQGTRSVSAAFTAMAKSILQSISQIASQEAFKALIRIGAGLITSAFGGGAGANALGGSASLGTAGGTAVGGAVAFQGGGFITKPTLAYLGEGPSYTKPEVVMNRQQMSQFLSSARQSGPSAGGQATGGISIINVASREEGERQAAQERSLGRQVIINEVLADLQQGSGSRIGRLMRVSQQ